MTREPPYHRLYRWSPQPQSHYAREGSANPWIAELDGEEWNIAYATLGEDIYELPAPEGFLQALRASMDSKIRHWDWGRAENENDVVLSLREYAWQEPSCMRAAVFHKRWEGSPPPLVGLFPCWHFSKWLTDWGSCLIVNTKTVRNDHPLTLMLISDSRPLLSTNYADQVIEKVKARKRKPRITKK